MFCLTNTRQQKNKTRYPEKIKNTVLTVCSCDWCTNSSPKFADITLATRYRVTSSRTCIPSQLISPEPRARPWKPTAVSKRAVGLAFMLSSAPPVAKRFQECPSTTVMIVRNMVGAANVWDITEASSGWVAARQPIADLSGRYSCMQKFGPP